MQAIAQMASITSVVFNWSDVVYGVVILLSSLIAICSITEGNVMCTRIFALLICISVSTNAFAIWITADDYALGEDVTHLTENVTLNWIKSVEDEPRQFLPSIIGKEIIGADGPLNHQQYFGGPSGAATYDAMKLVSGNPDNPGNFEALSIMFDSPTRSFGFKAENHSSDLILMALYDIEGNLLNHIFEGATSTSRNERDRLVHDFSYFYNFDVDVGSIILGGTSSSTYIYALALVPEPPSVLLLLTGLLGLGASRKLNYCKNKM